MREEGWVWELRGGGRGAAQGRERTGRKERRDATRSRCVRACLCGGARLRSDRIIRRALDATDRRESEGRAGRAGAGRLGHRPPAAGDSGQGGVVTQRWRWRIPSGAAACDRD